MRSNTDLETRWEKFKRFALLQAGTSKAQAFPLKCAQQELKLTRQQTVILVCAI